MEDLFSAIGWICVVAVILFLGFVVGGTAAESAAKSNCDMTGTMVIRSVAYKCQRLELGKESAPNA